MTGFELNFMPEPYPRHFEMSFNRRIALVSDHITSTMFLTHLHTLKID